MSKKYYEAVIKRVQVFCCPIVTDTDISQDEVECAIKTWWGLESHIENKCEFNEEQVELLRVCDSTSGLTSDEITSDSFADCLSGGIVVLRTRTELEDQSIRCVTYEREKHLKYVEDEDTQTSA